LDITLQEGQIPLHNFTRRGKPTAASTGHWLPIATNIVKLRANYPYSGCAGRRREEEKQLDTKFNL